jgi:hypothetical protein
MRTAVTFSAAVLLAAASAGPAAAQPRPPVAPPRPAFSPYLNLLWGGASPAFNYYALVRPQLQIQQQAAQLQQQINATNQAIQNINTAGGIVDPYLPATGRGATFGYYSHYYPTLGGGGGAVATGPRFGGYGGAMTAPSVGRPAVGTTGQAPPPRTAGRGIPVGGR